MLALTGIFTALSVFSSQRGVVTAKWVDIMSLLFGMGMYWLPIVLIASGLFIFLFGAGRRSRTMLFRFIGLLLFWVALQTLVHLMAISNNSINLTSPRPGDYGGLMGWGIAEVLTSNLGLTVAIILVVFLAVSAALMMLGITLRMLMGLAIIILTGMALLSENFKSYLRDHGPEIVAILKKIAQGSVVLLKKLMRVLPQLKTKASPQNAPAASAPVTTLPPDPIQASPPQPTVRIVGSAGTEWRLPRIEEILEEGLVGDLSEEDLAERARIIEDTLNAFGVPVTVVEVNKGPVVTQFGIKPGYVVRKVRGEDRKMKVRVSKIQTLSNDLSLALAASPIRIEAPVPGRDIVGIEVPNLSISMVTLRSILESEEFEALKAPLKIALGQDVSGRAVAASLVGMPHLLIAGATGSGKSVCVNAIICSLLFQYTPDDLRLIMVDPKRVELTIYNGIPHLIDDVITEVETVIAVLGWAVREMETRYKKLEKEGVRNIEAYNAQRITEGKAKMPYTVIFIDELADIMMMAPDEVEKLLVRLAQMSRAVGIHLVLATQRPSVNVVTGLIKANFPSRAAFAVTSQIDSRVILDTPGAEKLLGRGDMLFMRPDSAKLARLQGAFVSDAEVNRLVRYWRGQRGAAAEPASELAVEPIVQRPLWEDVVADAKTQSKRDVLYDEALRVVQESGRASVSLLQRRLQIGYTRAARLIDMMEADGIVGPDQGGSRGRKLLTPAEPEPQPAPPEPDVEPPVEPPLDEDAPPWETIEDEEWEDPSEEV